jgi:hypothetical protein
VTTNLYRVFKANLDAAVEAGLATSDRLSAWAAVDALWVMFDAHGGYGAWKDDAAEGSRILYRHATSFDELPAAA